MTISRLAFHAAAIAVAALACAGAPTALRAQGVPIHDLIIEDQGVPIRLVGYGLVMGLNGTGDNTNTGRSSQHTVQSVANLLRRFDVSVPPEMLRTRNVAAVLVTAEISPYLRAGGRFEVSVASVGDARSLRGGVLWMTPLVTDAGARALATAQGALYIEESGNVMRRRVGYQESSGRIPTGGILEADLPRPQFATVSRLLLREPDIGTAARIVAAIDTALGAGTAKVEDPGAIALTLKDGDVATAIARIRDLRVEPIRLARIVIDTRQGTVVAGGDLTIGPGIVSVGGLTLSIGAQAADTAQQQDRGQVRIPAGASVHQLVAALQAVRTPPEQIAQIFEALRQAGAISAEVVAR